MDGRRILAGLAAVPLVLLAVLLGACGSGGSSIADPPVSSAPTTSDPTTKPQHETAQRFVSRWFDVGTRMQNSGKTDEYLRLTKGCKDCDAVAKRVRDAYRAGGYFKTRGMRSVDVTDSTSARGGRVLTVHIDAFPTAYKTSEGSSLQHFKGGPAVFQVQLARSHNSWLVTGFAQVAS
jgi:hypothetical protein